jgi:hypothetical protein
MRGIGGRLLQGLADCLGDLRVVDPARRPRPRLVLQAVEPFRRIALPPLPDRVGVRRQARSDGLVVEAVACQKHDLGTPGQALRRLPPPCQPLQFQPFAPRQRNLDRRPAHRSRPMPEKLNMILAFSRSGH